MENSGLVTKFAAERGDRLLSQFAFQVSRCIKPVNAEAVHDLRVAIRRFSQALIVLGRCFPPREVKRVRRRLRKVMDLAGDVRDCDIAAKLVSKLGGEVATSLQRSIKMQRKEAANVLVAALKRSIDRKWSSKWRERLLVTAVVDSDSFRERDVGDLARRMLPKMAKDYFDCGTRAAAAKTSSDELHRFRIASKRLRYTLELFEPMYGPSLERLLEQIKAVQTLLGDANDCQMVRDLLSRLEDGQELNHRLGRRQRRKVRAFRALWKQQLATPENIRRSLAYLNDFAGRGTALKKSAGASTSSAKGRKRAVA